MLAKYFKFVYHNRPACFKFNRQLVIGGLAGVAATITHFAAFGVFNGVAILSRSIIDYIKGIKQ